MEQQALSLYTVLNNKFGARLQPQLQRKATLVVLSHALEDEVLNHRLAPVIFAAFQDARYYQNELTRYEQLRKTARSVTVFGRSLSHQTNYQKDWFVVVNEPRFKAVVACQEVDAELETPRESMRPFLGIWSYDPEVVDFACQMLAAQTDQAVARVVEEVVATPHDPVQQLRFTRDVSDRLMVEMENSNRRALDQITHNRQLLTEMEKQANLLHEVDSAKQLAETERNTLHQELRWLYDELTRSQTIMTQAMIEKARLDQAKGASAVLFEQIQAELTKIEPSAHSAQVLELLAKLQHALNLPA